MNRAKLEALTGVKVRNGCEWSFMGTPKTCPFLPVCELIAPTDAELLCEESDEDCNIPIEQVVDTWSDNTNEPLRRKAHPLARLRIDPTDEQWSKSSMSKWFGTGKQKRKKRKDDASTVTR